MKKLLLTLPIILLLSSGCNTQQVYEQTPAPKSVAQNTTPTPVSTTTPKTIDSSVRLLVLSPSSGTIGSKITITGTGFTEKNNTVNFGQGTTISNLESPNGSTLEFTVPSTENPPKCPKNAMCVPLSIFAGKYNISVTNSKGSSNSLTFTVTQNQNAAPVINSLNPNLGPLDSKVTIIGSGFTPTGNKIKFGDLGSQNDPNYSLTSTDGKTIVFTPPSTNYYACQASVPPCYPPNINTTAGNYSVAVINANGTSNSQTFTITQ